MTPTAILGSIMAVSALGALMVLLFLVRRLRRSEEQFRLLTEKASDLIRDVTEREQAALLYRFLVQHLPNTSVFLFDRSFRHKVIGGGFTGHTIPEAEALAGSSLWEVFPEDMASTLVPYYQKVFDGQVLHTEQHFRTRTYRIHFLPIQGSTGEIELAMAVLVDVTEENATVAELKDRTIDLERSNKDLEQFAHVASHELKSPLRRISSFADLLAEEYEGMLSAEADEYLHHIIDGVESLRSVIESLLTYSRVQTNRSAMALVNVNDVLAEVIKNLSVQVRETHARISVEHLPEALTADRTLLRQLFENLVCNAIKFNTTGRVPVVKIGCVRGLLEWEFSVADNGPGLDQAYQDKVFTMFQRFQPEVPGTGIGLALCKKIVGIHRGRIWFESTQGAGTTFKVSLPAKSPREVTQP
jgi:signal transduction histidine kinase